MHVRVMGAHDGLTAVLAERYGFDALWASGLAISASHGLPDSGILTYTEVHAAAVQMRHASSLPIIADVDSGFGDNETVARVVRLYESSGIDAVCIEDKAYPKRNSFVDGNELEAPDIAASRIRTAKQAQRTADFLVIARQESYIAGRGAEDALSRARLYEKAGADALLVHSRQEHAGEIEEYCKLIREDGIRLPIFAIPTTYHQTSSDSLSSVGISATVYANQLMRASITAMQDVLESCNANHRTTEIEGEIATLAELFQLVGMAAPAVSRL
jgi:phosphoenolpyruvate phosphomutase